MKCSLNIENGNREVIVTEKTSQGEYILEFGSDGFYLTTPNKYSIQVAVGKHLMHPLGMYINHSFEPSCTVTPFGLIANRDLEVGDKVTFNYLNNEDEITHPFTDETSGKIVNK